MQYWQMLNPHRHCQQKGNFPPQQQQIFDRLRRLSR
jgi:hypothetical protein